MIKGLGVDIIGVERFSQALARRRGRLVRRLFTPSEAASCGGSAERLAGRFAAKEAFYKALGTGLREFTWQDVEVKNNELGAPRLLFSPRLAAYLQEKGVCRSHISISHDREFALAQVILEAGPEMALDAKVASAWEETTQDSSVNKDMGVER